MIPAGVRGAVLRVLLLVFTGALRLNAQGTIDIEPPASAVLPSAPRIVVRTTGFDAAGSLLIIRLRLSLNSSFQLIVYDSLKVGEVVGFTMVLLLPDRREVFAEASVFDAAGRQLGVARRSIGTTGTRLELISPTGRNSVNIDTQQPTFIWRSAEVTSPPGPWTYDLTVTNVATGATDLRARLVDTVFRYPDTLQFNTSYRWKVVARLERGFAIDTIEVASASSFVVFPPGAALATLLYQNFPNPFPGVSSNSTCIWFDLQVPARVEIRILDIRGRRVRTIQPALTDGPLPAGRYGRLVETGANGCDARMEWDGTADDGRTVPSGVYLAQFIVDGRPHTTKKMLFRGR